MIRTGGVDDRRPALLRADDGAFTVALSEATIRSLTPAPTVRAVEIGDGTVRYLLPGGLAVDGEVTLS